MNRLNSLLHLSRWGITLVAIGFAFIARAHDVGLSIATVRLGTNQLKMEMGFSIQETEQIVSLDADHDGQVSADEFLAGSNKLATAVAEKCEVRFDGEVARAENARSQIEMGDRVDVILLYSLRHFREVKMKFEVIKQLAPGHRMFFTLVNPAGESLADRLLDARNDSVSIQIETAGEPAPAKPAPRTFVDFLKLGVEHIGTGYDHLLFLFGLLIVTRTFKSALTVITFFTLAHSITLAVATFNLFALPAQCTEPLIAATIVYVGVENILRRGDPHGRWMLTFAFGLIHGFGFASVLRDLGVGSNGSGVAMPLFAFNLGVELGQITLAAVALPLIWWLRRKEFFLIYGVPVSSAIVALAGAYWFAQRVFGW